MILAVLLILVDVRLGRLSLFVVLNSVNHLVQILDRVMVIEVNVHLCAIFMPVFILLQFILAVLVLLM